jgi:CBF/Mak21 family
MVCSHLYQVECSVDFYQRLDPFLPFELDPLRTQALDSSLWELVSHTMHYHAPVSTMCKIFSEAFTKPGYSMEDFLDHTYNTVCACPLLGCLLVLICLLAAV